jgi:hypothetical protein
MVTEILLPQIPPEVVRHTTHLHRIYLRHLLFITVMVHTQNKQPEKLSAQKILHHQIQKQIPRHLHQILMKHQVSGEVYLVPGRKIFSLAEQQPVKSIKTSKHWSTAKVSLSGVITYHVQEQKMTT